MKSRTFLFVQFSIQNMTGGKSLLIFWNFVTQFEWHKNVLYKFVSMSWKKGLIVFK
jgi:hypothetical protein